MNIEEIYKQYQEYLDLTNDICPISLEDWVDSSLKDNTWMCLTDKDSHYKEPIQLEFEFEFEFPENI